MGGVALAACVSGTSIDDGSDAGDAGDGSGAVAGTGTGSGGVAQGGLSQGGAAAQASTGGALATGGAVATGGVDAQGGAFPTGGVNTSGGTFPTGGVDASGGVATGGTPGTGGGTNCSDTPPPNGDTCANAVSFGWCGQDWMNGACARSCGTCSGNTGGTPATGGTPSTGGTPATGGTRATGGTNTGGTPATGGTSTGGTATGGTGGTVSPPPNISGGQNAWASRYWDCCKPACGWSANVPSRNPMKACSISNQVLSDNNAKNACEGGGSAFMCWNGAPWSVGGQLSYGFAAASGGNYTCGRCYHIQFNGSGHNGTNPGVTAINGKHMIVQVINNGGVAQDQFDLLIPGGGVGALNACDDQWGNVDLGAQYGGWRAQCGSNADCIRGKCQTAFNGKAELMAGCEWYIGWFAMADNPNFTYERIACPAAITQRSGLADPG